MLLADVEGARRVSDPSLPPGAAFWVRLRSRPQGLYLVCDGAAEAEVRLSCRERQLLWLALTWVLGGPWHELE